MKYLLCIFLFLGTCSTEKKDTKNGDGTTYEITGKIMQKSSYCGGARPSPELLESFKTPKPLKNFRLHLKEGDSNSERSKVVASTTTDDEGRYRFKVPNGSYTLVSDLQLNRSNFDQAIQSKYLEITDETCLNNWYKKGMISLRVANQDINNPDHLIVKKCDVPEGIPCLVYTGPVRP